MNRIDRLTAIIVMLQSKRIVKASEIADKYEISIRTVYRDIRALEEAGVPIGAEAGLGYYIMDGYSLPPVMFTKEEAGSILLAQKLMSKFSDKSSLKAYERVTDKIKSILPEKESSYWECLDAQTHVFQQPVKPTSEFPNHFLSSVQKALHERHCIIIEYYSFHNDTTNKRVVEPLGITFYSNTWHMVAFCQLRNDYRDFRIDRIKKLSVIDKNFNEHAQFSLEEYYKNVWEDISLLPASVKIKKEIASSLASSKYYFGFISENECENCIELKFMINDYDYIANWILSLGNGVLSVSPDKLKAIIKNKARNAYKQYN